MANESYEVIRAEDAAVAQVQSMILRLMRDKGWTKSELADHMDVSVSHISQILADEPKNLSVKKLARVLFALGQKLEVTCARIEEMNAEARTRNARKAAAAAHQVRYSWLNNSVNGNERRALEESRKQVAA